MKITLSAVSGSILLLRPPVRSPASEKILSTSTADRYPEKALCEHRISTSNLSPPLQGTVELRDLQFGQVQSHLALELFVQSEFFGLIRTRDRSPKAFGQQQREAVTTTYRVPFLSRRFINAQSRALWPLRLLEFLLFSCRNK